MTATDTPPGNVPSRQDVPIEQTWDLESIFPTDEAWERAFRDTNARLAEMDAFRGRLGDSAVATRSIDAP